VLRRAVTYAVGHDVVLVAAAADDPTSDQGEPANLLEPSGRGLVVTAATASGARARWAGYGSAVSVAAYGVGIFGDFPANATTLERECDCRASLGGSDGFAYLSGTSMAAAEVSGVAALVRAANPALSARRAIRVIERSAGATRIPDAAVAVRLAKAAR
jgi:subtilisin family serine protease